MTVAGIFHRPFREQLAYFRQKLNLGTEHWDDILGTAHDRAFIVAGAMKADLLTDLRGAVDKAIAEGTTLETFRRDFAGIVEKHGWSYRGGFAWRTKVIFETNLRASYQAGRWAQLNDPDLARVAPYWRYKHSDSVLHPRPLHVSWDGLTLPRDDPWWQTHFPPNGWGCFPGDVRVAGAFQLGLKALYAGQMVQIETGRGYRLAVTPNHPVLTPSGWRAAGDLREGDAVFSRRDRGADIPVGADEQQPLPQAQQVFDALRPQGLLRTQVRPEDFDGDGHAMHGDVHVVGAEGFLARDTHAQGFEATREGLFIGAQAARRVFLVGLGDRHPAAHRFPAALDVGAQVSGLATGTHGAVLVQAPQDRVLRHAQVPGDGFGAGAVAVHAADLWPQFGVGVTLPARLPRRPQQPLSASRAGLHGDPALTSGGGPVAPGDASLLQDACDGRPADAVPIGQGEHAGAIQVAADEVVSIRQSDFCGHVFDFQTDDGRILANGVVVSNCKCRVVAVRAKDLRDAKPDTAPDDGIYTHVDRRGVAHVIPKGIDYGWAHAPGSTWMPDLAKYPPEIAAQLAGDLAKVRP